jgi:hypothetical protein
VRQKLRSKQSEKTKQYAVVPAIIVNSEIRGDVEILSKRGDGRFECKVGESSIQYLSKKEIDKLVVRS